MNADDKVTACSDVITREVSGETVLLHLGSGTYFGLNEVGAFIWSMLSQDRHSLAAIRDKVTESFDVHPDRAMEDISSLLSELCERNLVTTAE